MVSKDLPATIGRYEVVRVLGRGGMGVVFLGRDPRIGRQVAIKLLKTQDEDVAERFLQEARSAGQLTHRNIITIHDCGEIDDGSERDGLPFIIMEFIEGTTLAELIRIDGSLSMSRKLELIEDLAAGLDYAHNNGVVHRDVKPANVMIDREGVLKILDFGIARVGGSGLTVFGTLMGTPSYMSPEQVAGRPVDRRSDVFAVGLVLYEILSGRQAFSGSINSVMLAIASEEPPALDALCPHLDADLISIVNKAIQKDEQHRYQTLADLGSDIALVRTRLDTRPLQNPLDSKAIGPARPGPERTPRNITPREQFARRRSENIEGHLDRARRAFEAGDFVGAIAAAEDAELLDPEEARVLDVLTSARERLDQQQIGNWLAEAERCIARRELESAGALVTKALHLDAGSAAALQMKAVIDRARREMEHDVDAVAAVERARKRFAGGDPAGSLSLLDAFSPPHRLVTQAREELTAELLEQERLKREREEQRRAEAVDRALAAAAGHLARHAWDDASRALMDAEGIDPQNARLLELREVIDAAREAAWARTKSVTRAVSAAAHSLTVADFNGAERFVNEALALEPSHAEAQALRSRIAELRAIAASAEEEPDQRQRQEAETRRIAAERERLEHTQIRRPVEAISAGVAVPSPAPSRRWAGAAIGLTLAVVIPTLLLGAWWRGHSSPVEMKPVVLSQPPPSVELGPSEPPRPVPPPGPAGPPPNPEPPAPRPEVPPAPRPGVPPGPPPAKPPPPDAGPSNAPGPAGVSANPSSPAGPEPPEMLPALPPASPEPPPVPVPKPVVPPVNPSPPPVVPVFDRGIADKILNAYVDAMRRLDFAAIKRLYPEAPDSLRLRMKALKDDYPQCDMTFDENFKIEPMSGQTEATVRTSGTLSCKRETRQRQGFVEKSVYVFRLGKDTSTGNWTVIELLMTQ